MKDSLRQKLDQIADRFEEVTALLGDPDVISDNAKFRALSVEHSELSEVVAVWQAFLQCEEDLATANEMLSDPDMRELAQDEIDTASVQLDELSAQLDVLMLPKTPTTKCLPFGNPCRHRWGRSGDF